ncbi:hypothetical protein ANAPH2_00550 [Anaplasma phagocytophilum]|nr:hypothetical protein ANAPH2_00550 [Anaplasma phagocytophilum]
MILRLFAMEVRKSILFLLADVSRYISTLGICITKESICTGLV